VTVCVESRLVVRSCGQFASSSMGRSTSMNSMSEAV
jgi:hypothetical protein